MQKIMKSAQPQQQLPAFTISLKELCTERQKYTSYPAFQRKEVWTLRDCQALIDSILLGDPIPSLEGYHSYNDEGETIWKIIDGHQRLSAILNFYDRVYKTWTILQKNQAEPGSDEMPVEPGKFFDQLSVFARNYFLDYRLQINQVRKRSDKQMITRFLRIQRHTSLSAAEKLNAHESTAKEIAQLIEKHSFWENFYDGKRKRGQVFQSSLHLLAIEMTSDKMPELRGTTFVERIAAGLYDGSIADPHAYAQNILHKLDIMSYIYAGTHFSVRGAVVPMYQSVLYLEQAGYTFQKKDKGRLAAWMGALILESDRKMGIPGYNRPLSQILYKTAQQDFWAKHRKTVLTLFGIC